MRELQSQFALFNVVDKYINPYPAKLIYLNFHPVEVVGRGSG